MKKFFCVLLLLSLAAPLMADDREKDKDRLQSAATVLDDVMSAPDKGIPEEILSSAKCLAVVPSLLKGGFIVGGAYGKGVASCKTEKGWSAPAFFRVEGGSFGLQIGGSENDVVLLVNSDKGMKHLLDDKFTMGADANVSAGPVGRDASAQTDAALHAEILSYSRSRGVFAGLALEGATLRPDKEADRELYGRDVTNKEILMGGGIAAPPAAAKLERAISRDSARAATK